MRSNAFTKKVVGACGALALATGVLLGGSVATAPPAEAGSITWTRTLNQCWYVVGGRVLPGYEGKYDSLGVWWWACYRG